jgi:polysaccharide chain length determinant protein (PEP-CTERM system associated)
MNDGDPSLQAQLLQWWHVVWRRRWLSVGMAWAIALLSIPAMMLVPNRYEGSAQIYVDTQTVLKPLMQGLAFTPDVDQQVRMLARTLISRPNVERLVDRPDLGLDSTKAPDQRDRLVGRLLQTIKIEPAGLGNLYLISYRDIDADRAKRMVEAILALFVDSGAVTSKRDSEEASQFIDEQIRTYEAKLVEAENRLKVFKLQNFGVSGVSNQDFFARISTLAEEVSKLRVDLASAEQSRDAYRRELAGENPQLPSDSPGGAILAPPSELDSRLEAQKRLLDEMLRRYTDEHPDVVSTRRVIAQLEQQRRTEAKAKAEAIATGKARVDAATSPVYQRIRIVLAETEAQVASLRSQLALKDARLKELRAAAGKVPQVEADLAQLNRDYDIISKNYQALVTRRESATLGVKLDEGSRLADFRVVEPPRVTPKPVFPSRTHIAGAAVLLALVLGIGSPILLELLLPTFKDSAALQKATGRVVLGTIALAMTPAGRRGERIQAYGVAAAFGVLILAQGIWLLWLSGQVHIG